MKKEEFVMENVNKRLDAAFEENWKELLSERKGSYKIVDDNLQEEAFIVFTAGYMSCYEDVKKALKEK